MTTVLQVLAPVFEQIATGEPFATDDPVEWERFVSAVGSVAAPDFEVAMVGPDPSFATEQKGLEGLLEAWGDWLSPYERYRVEIEEVIEARDRLVTLVRQSGVPKGGGPEISNRGAAVWTVRDGELVRIEFHLDRVTALRAAGVAPQSSQA